MGEETTESTSSSLLNALNETNSKIASFAQSLQNHLNNEDFDSSKDDLDFLHVKNSMMLSYLIDLTHLLRLTTKATSKKTPLSKLSSSPSIKACLSRLNEMRIAFERMRSMEKKLRYQIDKLLSLSSGAFALMDEDEIVDQNNDQTKNLEGEENTGLGAVNSHTKEEDPLSFKPNLDDWDNDNDDENSDKNEESSVNASDNDNEEDDEDLRAAKSAIQESKKSSKSSTAVYKPPRLFSTGTDSFSLKEKQEAKEMKQKRRKRQLMSQNSELLHTLRSEYTDLPEEEDARGGTNLMTMGGGLSAGGSLARRKFETQDRNRQKFEEEQFIRLVPSRKEKKERNRVFAEERSNLNEISDLGNLTKGITAFSNDDGFENKRGGSGKNGNEWEGRFENGKRKRGVDMGAERGGVRRVREGSKRMMKNSNPLQKELFGIRSSKGKKKKK